ncbi:hypothetical protein KW796_00675 [Candidatus Parcubacteria bacterium]|nr:hypothetical protein [Candidatus Parcubacteria bacterium]
MSSVKAVLSVAAGLIFIFAFFPYIKAIVKRQTCPRKATWFVWALGDIIILAGMIDKGTISGQLVGAVIGATTTFILSVKLGEPGWNTRDRVCVTLSLLSIGLWLYFGESNLGIGFSLLALCIAAWPTYVSAWEKPENEDKNAWIWFNVSSVIAVLAIPRMTFADAAPPIVFMAIDGVMIYLLFLRPKWDRVKTEILGW